MTLPVMAEYALKKGIQVLSAADFTHPVWLKEIEEQLREKEEGVYGLKNSEEYQEISFILTTEISCIYKKGNKLRRMHNLVLVPNLQVAEKLSLALHMKGANVSSDGRPIIGMSSKALLELVLTIDERSLLIPCHIWTPHFGLYGSASGFDSLEECFGDLTEYIYGIETGLSSDPEMNWRVKELENRSILSFSDAHSPAKMGREATVMELEKLNFANISLAIKRKNVNVNKIVYTIEFYPEEGKYHYTGHRNCKVSLDPIRIKDEGNMCPVCFKKLTEGVLFRVQQLASLSTKEVLLEEEDESGVRWFSDKTQHHPPYVKLVPLLEIVAEAEGLTVNSQKIKDKFTKLCRELTSELNVLLKEPLENIEKVGGLRLVDGIHRVRGGDIGIVPGYDGEYGNVSIWHENMKESKPQNRLDL
jgi:uncharacterized protein (TIGR00375 family)